jgi:hypothetical protein
MGPFQISKVMPSYFCAIHISVTLSCFKSSVAQVSVEHRRTWSYTYIHVDICVHICSCICFTCTLHIHYIYVLHIMYLRFKILFYVITVLRTYYIYMYVSKILLTQSQILRTFVHMWTTIVEHIWHILPIYGLNKCGSYMSIRIYPLGLLQSIALELEPS